MTKKFVRADSIVVSLRKRKVADTTSWCVDVVQKDAHSILKHHMLTQLSGQCRTTNMSIRLQTITITFIPGQFDPNIQISVGAMGSDPTPTGYCTIMQHQIDTLKSVALDIQRSVDNR